jgi:hypothetical protein
LQDQNADIKTLEEMVCLILGQNHTNNKTQMVEVSMGLWARKSRFLVLVPFEGYIGTQTLKEWVGFSKYLLLV